MANTSSRDIVSRDIAVVELKVIDNSGGDAGFVCSAYFPHNEEDPPPPKIEIVPGKAACPDKIQISKL